MRTIVITGANRGIGLELTKRYLESGDQVLALCRKSSPELRETQAKVIEGADVTDFKAMKNAAQEAGNIQVDLLICNAGLLQQESITSFDEAAIESCRAQFEVNTLGPMRTVSAFLPLLKENSRIAMITSRMGSIEDNTSGGSYGYRMSKCALNMATRSLVHDLRASAISIGLFHPGWVQTEMTNRTGHLTPEASSKLLVKRIEALCEENSGGFWHPEGERLPW